MHIFFSGIGGVGIGPLAEIAHDAGYQVTGSDAYATPMVDVLQARGIAVAIGQDGSYLQTVHDETPLDWFVYTAALPDDHPELVLARQLGIRTAKRDELLAHIIAEKDLKLVAVAGTHGKTTTTGMLIWTMQQLGLPVSYSVGATLSFGPSGRFDPRSEYFVYECDEFDRNFLHFEPHLSLITTIDYDHPDTYPSERDYLEAFRQFAAQSQRVVAWRDQHGDILDQLDHATLLDPSAVASGLTLHGAHNKRNATLVVTGLETLGLEEGMEDALNRFPGTDRRFQRVAEGIYSDYGHHPSEIAATLQLARELSDRVALVYQPHQNTRQHEVCTKYTPAIFGDADIVYWLPTYLSREDTSRVILTPTDLTAQLDPARVRYGELDDELWQQIQQLVRDGYLVLCMGAGSIDEWLRDKLAAE